MNWMEVALLVLGVGAFAASFIIPEKKGTKDGELQIDTELIKQVMEKETNIAKKRVTEVVDETLMYAVEKTERSSERISNEKIMAISEYSETVLADINKAHQEVMFLYDMLNDKHKNLKETVKIVDKQTKVVEEKANAAVSALAAKEEASAIIEKQIQGQAVKTVPKQTAEPKEAQRITLDMIAPQSKKESATASQGITAALQAGVNKGTVQQIGNTGKAAQPSTAHATQPMQAAARGTVQQMAEQPKKVEVYSFADQAPHVERTEPREMQAQKLEKTVTMRRQQGTAREKYEPIEENNNDKILRLYKSGMSSIDIAKELGLGVGEVKLVINLFKGAV